MLGAEETRRYAELVRQLDASRRAKPSEGGLEIMRETLARLGYPESDVQGYTDAVRGSRYDLSISSDIEQRALEQMMGEEKQDEPIISN